MKTFGAGCRHPSQLSLCATVAALWPGHELNLGAGEFQGDDDRKRRQQQQRDQPKIQFGRKKRRRTISFAGQTALTGHGTLL
jgi:hypothetical protein